MTAYPYQIDMPRKLTSRVVVSSPHSGRVYPDAMRAQSVLDPHMLRSSEDAFVDDLVRGANAFGAPVISALFPRAWVDLNRHVDELDPALIEDVPRGALNPRVASGLGVIPRVVAGGRCIYRGKIPRAEAMSRISVFWKPYHDKLAALMAQARSAFGAAVLVDCHSMPHEALLTSSPNGASGLPQIVIGDRFGASASRAVVAQAEAAFRAQGFRVGRNAPFAGAYIVEQYGRPSTGHHAIQIEIDRSIYMDEYRLTKRRDFDEVAAAVTAALGQIARWQGDAGQKLAAE